MPCRYANGINQIPFQFIENAVLPLVAANLSGGAARPENEVPLFLDRNRELGRTHEVHFARSAVKYERVRLPAVAGIRSPPTASERMPASQGEATSWR